MSEEILGKVRELLPALRERAAEAEELRKVPPESVKALQETGFFRMLQPVRYGGFESHPLAFYEAVLLTIARVAGKDDDPRIGALLQNVQRVQDVSTRNTRKQAALQTVCSTH